MDLYSDVYLDDQNDRMKRDKIETYLRSMRDQGGDISEAQNSSNNAQLIANIGKGLGQMYGAEAVSRGGRGIDTSVMDDIAAQAKGKLDMERENRAKKVREYLEAKRMADTDISAENEAARLQQEDEWRRSQAAKDEEWKQKTYDQRERQNKAENALNIKKVEQAGLDKNKKSAVELKKQGLADIGEQAEAQFEAALAKGKANDEYDPTSSSEWIDNPSLIPEWMKPNAAKSESAIEAKNAADSWIDSYLRDESGAAIPDDERFNYYRIYFPQPGDSEQAVNNKKALRAQKMKNARIAAGDSVDSPTQPPVNQDPADEFKIVNQKSTGKKFRQNLRTGELEEIGDSLNAKY